MTGAELATWRKAAGLTQAQLAARIGRGLRAVQSWEASAELRPVIENAIHGLSLHLAAEAGDLARLTPEAARTLANIYVMSRDMGVVWLGRLGRRG